MNNQRQPLILEDLYDHYEYVSLNNIYCLIFNSMTQIGCVCVSFLSTKIENCISFHFVTDICFNQKITIRIHFSGKYFFPIRITFYITHFLDFLLEVLKSVRHLFYKCELNTKLIPSLDNVFSISS